MYQFKKLEGFLYAADFLFLAALATIIIKLKLEKSSQGFSAKTQGVYGVVICTRNLDLLFVDSSFLVMLYGIIRKIINVFCIIYIVFKIKTTSKNNPTCYCNQDSFWVEALVLPCIIITAACNFGASPEEVLWSFSTYLETVAMLPQLYLIHVRGKGDSYLPAYIALMATYSLTDATAFSLNAFIYGNMEIIWPICKCIQLALYAWYLLIPKEAILPVANCEERRRRTTMFMRQQSLLAQTLLQKNNSSSDLQVLAAAFPNSPSSASIGSTSSQQFFEGLNLECCGNSPPASPCIKLNPAFEAESFRLKAPKISLKQLKNKGTLQLKSLPASPLTPRRIEYLKSISTISSLSVSSEDYIKSRINSKISRKRRMGISLPSSPEPNRKMEAGLKSAEFFKGSNYISKVKYYTAKQKQQGQNNISLPSTPVPLKKSELILRAPTKVPIYRSLSHMPMTDDNYYRNKYNQSLQPRLGGFTQSNTDNSSSEIHISLISNPSQTYQRISLPEDQKSETSVVAQSRSEKPKRPPLPKFILSTTQETSSEDSQRF